MRKLFTERGDIFLGTLHGGMRNGDGQVGKERFLGVVTDELERLLVNEIVRIGFAVEHHLFVVMPKVLGIKSVRLALAVVAVEFIPALVYRIAAGARRPEAPFAKHAGGVAGLLQELRNGDEVGGDRGLPFRLHLAVAAHIGVTGVHAVEQAAACGRTHGAAGIVLRKLHAGSRHTVDVRRLKQFLPVAAKVAVPGVINHDENEVGFLFRLKC